MATSRRVIFLPGVSGDGRFWQPVAERLPPCEKILVDYPGAGTIPHSSSVRSFDDLVALVVTRMNRPVDVVAQSMGGVIAVQAALARPQAVRRLAYQVDLTDQLHRLRIPTLLLWSDADEISPRAVGEHLSRLLPDSKLIVIKGGDHMFARDRPAEVTPHIERHLFGTR